MCQQNLLFRIRLWCRRHLIRHGASNFYVDITKIGQISCRHNMDKVKSNSDHRNSYFTGTPAAGAVRMPASRSCRTSATKSPLGLFKEISPKRNFFQRDPRRGSLSFHAAKRHENSLLLRFAEARRFRALRSATKGSAFGIRKPFEKGLSLNFILERASKFYVNITKIGQISADITWIRRNRIPTTGIRISRQCSPQGRPSEFVFHGNARRRRDHQNPYFAANCGAARRGACRRLRSIL